MTTCAAWPTNVAPLKLATQRSTKPTHLLPRNDHPPDPSDSRPALPPATPTRPLMSERKNAAPATKAKYKRPPITKKKAAALLTNMRAMPQPTNPRKTHKLARPREPPKTGILVVKNATGQPSALRKVTSLADHDMTSMSAAYAYAMTTGPMAPLAFNKDQELCIQYRHPLIAVDVDPRTSVFSGTYNPADPVTCPFISSLLLPFTQHRVERIRFGYVGLVPTTSVGTVVLTASLSDALTMPGDLLGALSYQGATACPVWGLTWTDWMQVTPPMPPTGYDITSLWRPNSVLATLKDGQVIPSPAPQVVYQILTDGQSSAAGPVRVGVLWCEVKLWARRVKVAQQAVLAMHEADPAILAATTAAAVNTDAYANTTQNDSIVGAFGAAPDGMGTIASTVPANATQMSTLLNQGSANFTLPEDYLSTINFDADWTASDGKLDVGDDPVPVTLTVAQNWDYLPTRLRSQLQPEDATWTHLEHGDSVMDVAILGVADGITIFYVDPQTVSLGEDAHHVHRRLTGLLHKRDPDAPMAANDMLTKLWGVAKAGISAAATVGSSIASTANLVGSTLANASGSTIVKSIYDVATSVPSLFFHTLNRADAARKLKHINTAVVVRNPNDTSEAGSVAGPTLRSTLELSGGARRVQVAPAVTRNPFSGDEGGSAQDAKDSARAAATARADDGWVPVSQTSEPQSTGLVNALATAQALAAVRAHADLFKSALAHKY